MELTEANVREFISSAIRPKVRVDGGDITFDRLDGQTVHLTAHADCAGCPATERCLSQWIKQQLASQFGLPLQVTIRRLLPYFSR